MVPVTDASGLRSALERSGGTVTDFLELLVGEVIDAQGRRHAMIPAPSANRLQLEAGRPLLQRAATLRGRTSGSSYVYAESAIVTSRLPAWFGPRLESSNDPIGRMLHEAGLAITREELAGPDSTVLPLRPGSHPPAGEWLLTRTYRISVGHTPLMVITEWFLTALGPFLPGPARAHGGDGEPLAGGDPSGRT